MPRICEHSHQSNVSKDVLNNALKVLKAKGLRMTAGRHAILEVLLNEHGPFSIEEIHHKSQKKAKNVDLVTAYRTLAVFEEHGLVRSIDLGDRIMRYEYSCAEHPHHHLICKICKKVEIIEADLLGPLKKLAHNKGFAQLNPSVDLFGICTHCA